MVIRLLPKFARQIPGNARSCKRRRKAFGIISTMGRQLKDLRSTACFEADYGQGCHG
jgi:hypothetical protein